MILYFLLALINRNAEKEIELVEKINMKDEKALSDLYDQYSKILYSLIIKIVKVKEDAEEILQWVFLQVWNKSSAYDKKKGSVFSWLITLSRNKAIDKIRSKKYKNAKNTIGEIEEMNLFYSDSKNPVMDAALAGERAEIVKNALDKIPGEQKTAIELAYFEGLTQVEISEKLNVPLGTIKTRTKQGLIKLRNLLSFF